MSNLIINNSIKRFYSISKINYQKITHVSVIGSGLMGSGIAQVTAQAGFNVALVDQNEAILSKSLASIKTSLQRIAKKKFENEPQKGEQFVNDTIARISITDNVEKAVQKTDLSPKSGQMDIRISALS